MDKKQLKSTLQEMGVNPPTIYSWLRNNNIKSGVAAEVDNLTNGDISVIEALFQGEIPRFPSLEPIKEGIELILEHPEITPSTRHGVSIIANVLQKYHPKLANEILEMLSK